MLIFARHGEEDVVIDNHVRLKVKSISDNRVTVGVIAPPDVPVRHCQHGDRSSLDCGPLLVPESEPVG